LANGKSILEGFRSCCFRLKFTFSAWQYYHWILFFVLVPLANLVITLIPSDILENYFVLHPSSPSIFSMFISNYTQTGLSHLSFNLALYLIIVVIIFSIEQRTRFFFWVSLSYFSVLPIFLSIVTLLFLIPFGATPDVKGFSGIALASLGYLIYLGLYRKVYRRFLDRFFTRWKEAGGAYERFMLFCGLFIMDSILLILISSIGRAAGQFSMASSGISSNGIAHLTGLSAGVLIPMGIEVKKHGLTASNLSFLVFIVSTMCLSGFEIARAIGVV
jgi:hypothetical protein